MRDAPVSLLVVSANANANANASRVNRVVLFLFSPPIWLILDFVWLFDPLVVQKENESLIYSLIEWGINTDDGQLLNFEEK